MVIDPIANLWAQATNRTQYAYEMCDPVEEDTFMVDGIKMSNFVHPSWFEPFKHPRGTKFESSWKTQEAVQHDQGRLRDHQAERQGEGGFRVSRKGKTLCNRKPPRSPQRIPQTPRTSYQAGTKRSK